MKFSEMLLVVARGSGSNLPQQLEAECHVLELQFSPQLKPAADTAQLAEQAPDCHLELSEQFMPFSGGFSQQVLNLPVADYIRRHGIRLLLVADLYGCTLDLPRIARLLGIKSVIALPDALPPTETLDAATVSWIGASLASADFVVGSHRPSDWNPNWIGLDNRFDNNDILHLAAGILDSADTTLNAFDYTLYEVFQRDHPLLTEMQKADTRHFLGCGRVLDLACGVGIFLHCLRTAGINSIGVERQKQLADYGRGMGLDIVDADVFDYLRTENTVFDGIYCSHFIEHLDIEGVQQLLKAIGSKLTDRGVLVLVFPDPESIRSQLLGFWRDPEHVRFYHPELVISLATLAGFDLEWSSYEAQPHPVIPFSGEPPTLPELSEAPDIEEPPVQSSGSAWDSLLGRFGLASRRCFDQTASRVARLEQAYQQRWQHQRALIDNLVARTDTLWQINQTWAWNDNVTLKFRKR